ncbi:hypothetical protein CS8_101130 [Cupriavidus sp. 8B]
MAPAAAATPMPKPQAPVPKKPSRGPRALRERLEGYVALSPFSCDDPAPQCRAKPRAIAA